MADSILNFFVDTNLFLQCLPLEQLDWSPWDSFEKVRLIVSKPVLREIDYRKNKGNDRAAKRARATYAMFRRFLKEGDIVVHEGSPRVVLCVESWHQYSEDLRNRLDYGERDDQLIGTIYEFARLNPSCDVQLLTHDAAALFTANDVGLAAHQILDDWLLPSEPTKVERELASLKQENDRLKKAEPSMSLRCVDQSDSHVETYEYAYKYFDPLTGVQIDELMDRLRACFPLATNFGPAEPQERIPSRSMFASLSTLDIFRSKEVFTPATDDEIAKYREQAYPKWLEQCQRVLRQYHLVLQEQVPVLEFCFLAENTGTRPADHALVTIEAFGSFQIMPPPFEEDDGQEHDDTSEMREGRPMKLFLPPDPPTGRWQTMMGHYDLDSINSTLRQLASSSRNLEMLTHYPLASAPKITPRDPNKFYYKNGRPSGPQQSFSLECDQWRHGNKEEAFLGDMHVSPNQEACEGKLVCRIEASNLSKPVFLSISVRITVAHVSAFESAQTMVERLSKLQNLGRI